MRNVYYAGQDLILKKDSSFKKLLESFGRELKDEEVEQVKHFAIDYYNFINNDFDEIIEDRKANEKPEGSFMDCRMAPLYAKYTIIFAMKRRI